MSREVVITGVGAVTPLGVGARTLHERWSAGVVGIEDGRGRASEFDPTEHLSVKEARRADRFTQFALVAGDEALGRGRLDRRAAVRADRIASILGTGIGGIGTLERGKEILIECGEKKVPPLSVPLMMSNAAAAAVSMRYKLLGPCHGVVSACSGGADAIGTAKMMIESGLVDAVVTGGSEAAHHADLDRVVQGARRAVQDRHLAPVRPRPRRLRHGRGRRDPGARDARGRRGARREDPRHAARLRRVRRRVPPDGAGQDRRRAVARDGAPRSRTPASRRRTSSTSTRTAPRRGSTTPRRPLR